MLKNAYYRKRFDFYILKLIDNFPTSSDNLYENQNRFIDTTRQAGRFFSSTVDGLKISNHLNSTMESTLRILESLCRDMLYLSEIDANTAIACEIMKTYVVCFLIVKKNEISKCQSSIDCNKLIQIEEVNFTTRWSLS